MRSDLSKPMIRLGCRAAMVFVMAGCGPSHSVSPSAPIAQSTAPEVPVPSEKGVVLSYSLKGPSTWSETKEGGSTRFVSPEGDVSIRLLVLEGLELSEAIDSAWEKASPTMKLRERQRVAGAGSERFSSQLVVTYLDDAGDEFAQAVALEYDKYALVFLVEGPRKSIVKRGAELGQIIESLDIEGAPRTEVKASEVLPFDEARRQQVFEFAQKAREIAGLPGVAVTLVSGDDIWTAAYGVREEGKDTPVDGDTQFMIGSVTKSFSTLLLATLVDEGKLTWEQPVRTLYPSFRLSDEKRSEEVQLRHLFCACVGAERRDMELLFEYANVQPKDVFEQVRNMKLTTGFGETFQYNNQLTAVGGFIAGHVAHPALPNLGVAYRRALEKRVLEPLEMTSSQIDFDAVVRGRKNAMPHQLEWSGKSVAVEMGLERFVSPYAPAGALWSTPKDMGKYLRMQLKRGMLPGGKRLVSEENLGRTQTGQVKITDDSSYGMGWIVGKTKGLVSVEHSGGTMGFTSNLVFFPEIGVGLFTAVNRSPSGGFHSAVANRLMEVLFDLEPRIEAALVHGQKETTRLLEEQRAKVSSQPVPAEVLGRYKDPSLGNIVISRVGDRVMLDAGEWKAPLAMLDEKEAVDTLIVTGAPLQGLVLRKEERDGKVVLVLKHGQTDYVFRR